MFSRCPKNSTQEIRISAPELKGGVRRRPRIIKPINPPPRFALRSHPKYARRVSLSAADFPR